MLKNIVIETIIETGKLELKKLCMLLKSKNIPYHSIESETGGSVFIGEENEPLCEAIFGSSTIGYRHGLLEIAGGLTAREEEEYQGVKGYLTAEEVFKRMEFCYENNTSEYVEEIEDFSLSINEFKIIERSFENWTKSNVNNFKVDLEKNAHNFIAFMIQNDLFNKGKIKEFLKENINGK